MSPAELSLIAIRAAQRFAGSDDPFIKQKREANEMVMSLYPEFRERVRQSDDPLFLACQLAACGNIIDLGMRDDYDIHTTIDKVLTEGFRLNVFDEFRADLDQMHKTKETPRILYCCDNAGEIVFDRLFIEEILNQYPRIQITAVVRKVPVLNDATMEDAKFVGLDQVVPVIDNGTAEVGTVIAKSPSEFLEIYYASDIIISKGQANYETLAPQTENIYFILKAKCEVIAGALGVNLLDAVMTRSQSRQFVQIEPWHSR